MQNKKVKAEKMGTDIKSLYYIFLFLIYNLLGLPADLLIAAFDSRRGLGDVKFKKSVSQNVHVPVSVAKAETLWCSMLAHIRME